MSTEKPAESAAWDVNLDELIERASQAVTRITQNVTITAAATDLVSGADTVSVTDNDVAGDYHAAHRLTAIFLCNICYGHTAI